MPPNRPRDDSHLHPEGAGALDRAIRQAIDELADADATRNVADATTQVRREMGLDPLPAPTPRPVIAPPAIRAAGAPSMRRESTDHGEETERLEDEEGTAVLPGRNEMMRRLAEVDANEHLREHFHPLLLRSAGRALTPGGVGLMLHLAAHDYVKGLPRPVALTMSALLHRQLPVYVAALVDDKAVAEAAKAFLREARG